MVFQAHDVVMFGDVDASGIGHFAHQVRYLERAEFFFMRELGFAPEQWFLTQYLFPRVRLEVDYLSPLRFGDTLRYEVQVGHLGRTSYSLDIDVVNETQGQVAMKTRLTIVTLDPASGRPTPVPERLREAFSPYLAQPAS
ncbi:MAG: thioesterase family protein [Firmicutes bacterium]|nr:thioesterase family protein [Bacillota bacterium]